MSDLEIWITLFVERIIPAIIGLFIGGLIFFTWWHVHEIKEKQNIIGQALGELLRRIPRPDTDFLDDENDEPELTSNER